MAAKNKATATVEGIAALVNERKDLLQALENADTGKPIGEFLVALAHHVEPGASFIFGKQFDGTLVGVIPFRKEKTDEA